MAWTDAEIAGPCKPPLAPVFTAASIVFRMMSCGNTTAENCSARRPSATTDGAIPRRVSLRVSVARADARRLLTVPIGQPSSRAAASCVCPCTRHRTTAACCFSGKRQISWSTIVMVSRVAGSSGVGAAVATSGPAGRSRARRRTALVRARRATRSETPKSQLERLSRSRSDSGFAEKDQERRLEGVFDVVRIVEPAAADSQNHRAVPCDQFRKGRLIAVGEESLQELALAEAGQCPVAKEAHVFSQNVPDRSRSCPSLLATWCHDLLLHGTGGRIKLFVRKSHNVLVFIPLDERAARTRLRVRRRHPIANIASRAGLDQDGRNNGDGHGAVIAVACAFTSLSKVTTSCGSEVGYSCGTLASTPARSIVAFRGAKGDNGMLPANLLMES